MLRFLHAADLHLDSARKTGEIRRRGVEASDKALRGAVENLVRTAIERSVSLVIIAGDVYDGDCHDFNTPLFFASQMQRLASEGIRVVLISGNHDAENKMTRTLRELNYRRLSCDSPETIVFDDLGVAIHGQGFAQRDVYENLALGYPRPISGLYNIGVLHTSAENAGGHKPYASCSVKQDLVPNGYDYWALGHIHKRQTLFSEPHVVFPGNIQGRDVGETGPKGCYIVEVDSAHNAKFDFVPLDVMRWEHVAVDLSSSENEDDVFSAIRDQLLVCHRSSDGLPTAVRVTLAGPCRLHEKLAVKWSHIVPEVRNLAIQTADGNLWVEKVLQRTKPFAEPDAAALEGPLGELLSIVNELRADEEALAALAAEMPELRSGGPLAEYLAGSESDWLREQLPAVESLLVGHLTGSEARR